MGEKEWPAPTTLTLPPLAAAAAITAATSATVLALTMTAQPHCCSPFQLRHAQLPSAAAATAAAATAAAAAAASAARRAVGGWGIAPSGSRQGSPARKLHTHVGAGARVRGWRVGFSAGVATPCRRGSAGPRACGMRRWLHPARRLRIARPAAAE